ncbi:MAG: sulfatase-like hydrolase/transferase, partial [Planctomycetales bacterium]|nr:sulfatase-like hydrolase/transferase [Planctomycetales bacterium]
EEQGWESSRMAAYAGMVDRLDQEIGRLIEYLKQKGVYDNTLLVFVSDNGACPFDRTKGKELEPFDSQSYWTYDTGWAHVGNVPFRYYKQNSHEGGIASPAIFHWPQVIGSGSKVKPNSLDATPAHLIDLMATCLDVAGVNYPDNVAGRPIDPLMRLSLKPVLVGAAMPERPYMYFHFSTNRALRIKDW